MFFQTNDNLSWRLDALDGEHLLHLFTQKVADLSTMNTCFFDDMLFRSISKYEWQYFCYWPFNKIGSYHRNSKDSQSSFSVIFHLFVANLEIHQGDGDPIRKLFQISSPAGIWAQYLKHGKLRTRSADATLVWMFQIHLIGELRHIQLFREPFQRYTSIVRAMGHTRVNLIMLLSGTRSYQKDHWRRH